MVQYPQRADSGRRAADEAAAGGGLQGLRSFDHYYEEADDGSLNEQEHERRVHAHAQECVDCAPDLNRPTLPSGFGGRNAEGAF